MATSHPAPDENIIDMTLATPGKDAVNPDKTATKRALFLSSPTAAHNKTNESTPATTEKRNTRESYIVIPRGGDPLRTPEQIISFVNKSIDAEPQLEERLKTKPLEMSTTAMIKITSESLDGSLFLKHKDLVFMKEGLQNMQTMLVMPKSACIGAIASQLAGYMSVYQQIGKMTQKGAWCMLLPWMKEVDKLFDSGSDGEFEMSFERSLDRHKEKIKYCADAMALGFSSWALPHVINALISALRIEFVSSASAEHKEFQDKHFAEFKEKLQETLKGFGIHGPERDDGWVVYPLEETVEITAKGLDLLRLQAGNKVEMKKLISTDELISGVEVYVAPQAGIFNIKRAYREGGEGLEAVITELGDDVLTVIPRNEMDTEATGLIKLTLRIKLTAEKEIEKKLQALCKDPRNDVAEAKGIVTKLTSGAEVRMIWSGDLGTARVRNGLNRVAAISAELVNKSSEEVKKLKGELEKQIKVNADALVAQDTKISAYTAHMQELMDKQTTVISEMQTQHATVMSDLQKQMVDSEAAYSRKMGDMQDVIQQQQQQMGDMQAVIQQQQHMQLAFTAQAGTLTQTIASFMASVKQEMLEQKTAMLASSVAIKELQDGKEGYAEAASALVRWQHRVLRDASRRIPEVVQHPAFSPLASHRGTRCASARSTTSVNERLRAPPNLPCPFRRVAPR